MLKEKRGKGKLWLYILLAGILIIALAGAYFIYSFFYTQDSSGNTSHESTNVNIPKVNFVYEEAQEEDYTNFEKIISENQMIQDIPDDGKIILSFYKFVDGEKQTQKEYLITKGSVQKSSDPNYDIKLSMHSKYLTVLDENNFCLVVLEAKNNGDFYSETALSTLKLAWKYKGMMEYKDCLGL